MTSSEIEKQRVLFSIRDQLKWANWLKFIELVEHDDKGIIPDDIWETLKKGIGIEALWSDT